ncbi:Phospholipase_D-nuclease N-terminal [Verrucomicrobium sp. GAS474]|uniref:PLDc N-terminal domain-containing protein n=1 Tax=Verrucomicrobium sp. GAS474 TaxID=1882831 RepID=UPI000879262E|nr:PLDc N-terminal domain-containing protein [Verrucomicrobium sp. GAS474]SDT93888.1 Phospholipase_D-nuclease N-terminal [Verrucomicrobium sp. GAS474]
MPSLNLSFSSLSSLNDLWPVMLFWAILFVGTLVELLRRRGFDPVTRLTWVVIVVFVPVVGLFLYWLVPKDFSEPLEKAAPKKASPSNSLAGTPWENDPGHTL